MYDLTDDQETGAGIESGSYDSTIEEATVNATKSGTGEYIKVKFRTEFGNIVYHNFNVKNDNEQAAKIGRGQLKAMMRVSGKADPLHLSDPQELVGLRVNINVKVEDKDNGYGPQARITTFNKVKSESPAF